jgi:hypothetical protein
MHIQTTASCTREIRFGVPPEDFTLSPRYATVLCISVLLVLIRFGDDLVDSYPKTLSSDE